jgi:hypothetical protein
MRLLPRSPPFRRRSWRRKQLLRGWRVAFLPLLLAAVAGCGEDKTVSPKPTQVVGVWRATVVQFISKSDPNQRVELISAGDTVKVVIGSDQGYTYIDTPSGGTPDTTTGIWRLDGDLFRVRPTGMPFEWVCDVSYSGGTLSLKNADMEYDVNGDDLREMTKQSMLLVH